MPNGTEKQVSSEIAQSRERFEKAAKPYFNNGESFCPWDGDHYADEIAEGMWQMYLAAERDTRELKAALSAAIPFVFEYGSHQNKQCYRGSDDGCHCGLDEAKEKIRQAEKLLG